MNKNQRMKEGKLPNAMVVIGGAFDFEAPSAEPKLLAALPRANLVLEIGHADSPIGAIYLERFPDSQWINVDPAERAFSTIDGPIDLLVLSNGLPSLELLTEVSTKVTPNASLFAVIENAASWSGLTSLLEGDVDAHAAPLSLAAAYKRLLDAGWMPTLADQHVRPPPSAALAAAAPLVDALSVPLQTAGRTLGMSRAIVQAVRGFDDTPRHAGQALFSVVVPTTRETQLRANIERSPGLQEVNARVICYRNAHSPAEALSQSLSHCDCDWVLLCHQDVYFPRGFGEQLNAVLASVPADARASSLFGFIGVGLDKKTLACDPAGFVIDRLHRASHPASDTALSIDELALVVARDSIHRIDPALGWHLWATDLCLTSISQHQVFPRIVRLPLFHNSITDYELPPAFMASASVLAQKHASFGPIPTLCGTIDEGFLSKHGRSAPAVTFTENEPLTTRVAAADLRSASSAETNQGIELVLQPVSREVDALIDAGKFDEATAAIYRAVHLSYTQDGIKHRALYYPEFDRQVMRLAKALSVEPGQKRSGAPGVPLLIATELYELGGHSRVLEEVSREMPNPVLVLTDLFRSYHRNPALLEQVKQRFPHTQLVVLPDAPLWDKCRMLRTLDLHLVPRSTLYFTHHQDPIAFIGTLAQEGLHRLFIHHGDHNPSLGCTLPGVKHVDLIDSLQMLCSAHLCTQAKRLPLHIADRGRKCFTAIQSIDYSVVTSGHPAKFARNGPLALQELVATALATVKGRFFHIGPIEEAWVTEIRTYLRKLNLDASRFVPLGLVPSVWDTLKTIEAAVYIGSAPVSGGRAAIEAQGCGYPVLYFNGFAQGSLLADYSSYADPALGWGDTHQLAQLLTKVGNQHAELSQKARAFYEAEFSISQFREALKGLLDP
jgi:hypothetical protein